jgi:hypothetical protein
VTIPADLFAASGQIASSAPKGLAELTPDQIAKATELHAKSESEGSGE